MVDEPAWIDFYNGNFANHRLSADKWDNDQVWCWLLTHKSGAYVIWSAWTGKQPKKYPDIETAKIAVELQL